MPWEEVTIVSQRYEFVQLAGQEGANISRLCRRFGISRKTGYKWLHRYREQGQCKESLVDQSRRPARSPSRTSEEMEQAILAVRSAHPAWGGRKIRAVLIRKGHSGVPSPSTITAVLRRHGQIDVQEAEKHRACQRFERANPNELWQMDFKGHFSLFNGGRCHPLTALDDCSRYLLTLTACRNETDETVRTQLTKMFRCYGLPQRILVDNGTPWGIDAAHPHTAFTVWLMRLGIAVSHGRVYHPQTQGKAERLHRTLQAELLSRHAFADLEQCQVAFDHWRDVYNHERPHEALQLNPPSSRYRPSPRAFPEHLPPVVYSPGDTVRRVDVSGRVFYRNRRFRVGKAFRGQQVALRPTEIDGKLDVFFADHRVAEISLLTDNGSSPNV